MGKRLYLLDDEDISMIAAVIGRQVPVDPCEHGKIDGHRKLTSRCWAQNTDHVCSLYWCEGAGL